MSPSELTPGSTEADADRGFSSGQEIQRAAESANLTEVDKHQETEFLFVLCDHYKDLYGADIADALRDCDCIAIEVVGGTLEERAEAEQDYQDYLSPDTAAARREFLADLLQDEDPLFYAILNRLIENNDRAKRVVLIDASEDDAEAYQKVIRTKQARSEYYDKLRHYAQQPNNELLELLATTIQTNAEAIRARDRIVKQQLLNLSRAEESNRPQRIGVVVGASHTGVNAELLAEGSKTSKIYIGRPNPSGASPEPHYTYKEQAARYLVANPDQPLDPDLLNRTLLHNIHMSAKLYLPQDRPATDEDFFKVEELYQADIEQMTDDEVLGALAKLDELKTAGLSKDEIDQHLMADAMLRAQTQAAKMADN